MVRKENYTIMKNRFTLPPEVYICIAAVSLAERVAAEWGDAIGVSIGYTVRLKSLTCTSPCYFRVRARMLLML